MNLRTELQSELMRAETALDESRQNHLLAVVARTSDDTDANRLNERAALQHYHIALDHFERLGEDFYRDDLVEIEELPPRPPVYLPLDA